MGDRRAGKVAVITGGRQGIGRGVRGIGLQCDVSDPPQGRIGDWGPTSAPLPCSWMPL